MRIDGERADGLTHKIREELADGLTFRDGVVQVVTWARTKGVVIGGLDGTDSLDSGVDGGFDGGYDGGSGGFDGSDGFDGFDGDSEGFVGGFDGACRIMASMVASLDDG